MNKVAIKLLFIKRESRIYLIRDNEGWIVGEINVKKKPVWVPTRIWHWFQGLFVEVFDYEPKHPRCKCVIKERQ